MGAGLLHEVTGIALGLLRRSSGTVPSEQEVTSMVVCLRTRSKISLASLAVRASRRFRRWYEAARARRYQFLKDGPIRRAASASCEA
jgi:hypothetical protein